MIIKRLHLHNFGVYAGDNEFVFDGQKPIVLIGGMNGRGKTTFLEAVLLSLYGKSSVAYTENEKKSYSQYLRSFVNRESDDKTCSIRIEFEINNNVREFYSVTRSWDGYGARPTEKITVCKDGEYNEFLTNNWPMFVENILPSALSSFFFFDGEKISELAVDNTNVQLKNSIRSMLGINVLQVLGNDIRRNLKRIGKTELHDQVTDEVLALRERRDQASFKLSEANEKLVLLNDKLTKDQDALEVLQERYTAKGGDAANKRQELLKQKSTLVAELSVVNEKLEDMVAEELPLVLVRDLVESIKERASQEHTSYVMNEAMLRLQQLFESFSEDYFDNIDSGRDFLEYVQNQTRENQLGIIYGLSEQGLYQVNALVDGPLNTITNQARSIIQKKKNLDKQIAEIESFLAIDIDENDLRGLLKKIKDASLKVAKDQFEIEELEKKRSELNANVIELSSEFTKLVESYLATVEMRDSEDRLAKYSNMALNVLQKYQIELQKRKTGLLADTITKCYHKIANKKTLIDKINMDPETLDWKCVSSDNREIPRSSLSAGEKQLLVISVLWALAICSKKKLPVIIDTPLSRLDSLHRTALITTYFPNAGEQTIILSTDSEIDANYYQLMKNNIGNEFTLIYDETTKSTTIEQGYLIGAE